jgi:hypothetical protein
MANRGRTKLRQVCGISNEAIGDVTDASSTLVHGISALGGCKPNDVVVVSWAGTRVAGVLLGGHVNSAGVPQVVCGNYTTSEANTEAVLVNVVVLRAGL